jgi:hypothetical protein
VIDELARQGVADVLSEREFDVMELAKGGHQGGRRRRGPVSATFFLACLAAMELEDVVLDEI